MENEVIEFDCTSAAAPADFEQPSAPEVGASPAERAAGLLAHARRIAARLPARADALDRTRDVSDETIAELKAAGLFRILQPRRWGGHELDLRVLFDAQNAIAETCASTAWVHGVLSVQAFLLALFDERAQADVWGADGAALVSSAFQPTGTVTPVEGGFRLSGRWSFSSGSSHAQWVLVGGLVASADGATRTMRLFLIPRPDYRIDDVWQTFGLRGTGSNDIVVDAAFVPAHRSYAPDSGLAPRAAIPGLASFYALPWMHVFSSSISNFSIGAARGALTAFARHQSRRPPSARAALGGSTDPASQAAARLRLEIDTAEAGFARGVDRLLAGIERHQPAPLDEALLYRAQMTSTVRKLTACVDDLMVLLGGHGVGMRAPLTRVWLDLCAARGHPGNDPTSVLTTLGNDLLEAATGTA